MKIYITILLALIFIGCHGTKVFYKLSELTIENKKANSLIEHRKPDYGINGLDGDVVMSEISMDIQKLKEDSIEGRVFDSGSKEPLPNAELTLIVNQERQKIKQVINSDISGFFKSALVGKLIRIEVSYIGYRVLLIKLKK